MLRRIQRSIMRVAVVFATSMAVIGAGVTVASSAGAATIYPYSYGPIVNANSGQCLAVWGGAMRADQPAVQWPCIDSPDQDWSFYPISGDPNWYQIHDLKDPSYCLSSSAPSGLEGLELMIELCNSSSPDEYFKPTQVAATGDWVLTSGEGGLVAAVNGASTSPGAAVIGWQNQVVNGSHLEQQWDPIYYLT